MTFQSTRTFDVNDPNLRQFMTNTRNNMYGTATLGNDKEIMLTIKGFKEYIRMSEGNHYELGRFEEPEANQLNLTSYGALERGISRQHAKFYLFKGRLYLADMGSTNGTYVRGRMLQPAEPTLLYDGDEILLGRMRITVEF